MRLAPWEGSSIFRCRTLAMGNRQILEKCPRPGEKNNNYNKGSPRDTLLANSLWFSDTELTLFLNPANEKRSPEHNLQKMLKGCLQWFPPFQIASVSGSDGGNYTCSPQNILSDTVMVNIMEVKKWYKKTRPYSRKQDPNDCSLNILLWTHRQSQILSFRASVYAKK